MERAHERETERENASVRGKDREVENARRRDRERTASYSTGTLEACKSAGLSYFISFGKQKNLVMRRLILFPGAPRSLSLHLHSKQKAPVWWGTSQPVFLPLFMFWKCLLAQLFSPCNYQPSMAGPWHEPIMFTSDERHQHQYEASERVRHEEGKGSVKYPQALACSFQRTRGSTHSEFPKVDSGLQIPHSEHS